jgi:hypothetical protein
MKIAARHALVRPVTIPELARLMGKPRRTVFRWILRMHAGELTATGVRPAWIFRPRVGPWRVNCELLRQAHPEFFSAPDIEEIELRLEGCERKAGLALEKVNALGAAWRKHRQDHEQERQRARKRESEPPP